MLGCPKLQTFLKITPSCCFSHDFFIVSEENTKKFEKSYYLRVDQSIPWFTTQSHSIEMTDWLRYSKKPSKYYGRLTKMLHALEDM